ncbi:WbqC family protein [Flavobacterium sp. NRK F10]|uniref:WbqC family protein n=1 Tax=Flavobacterium sp. NRK F10 TaxID=2954931 RepID=UPI002091E365|nr:WbqC family protein [Flavobacterium sp. NRK F10]MCO6174194.1 WbqC family protein [Flavobacterium sp. NRK F10]
MANTDAIAVMQPYVFPYIGYFQLINAVDVFVLYDDVNFIKGGWINRNRILLKEEDHTFTISCKKISSFSRINEIEANFTEKDKQKFLKKIEQSYIKAPYFEEAFAVVKEGLNGENQYIAEMCKKSISSVLGYLDIDTKLTVSSVEFSDTLGMGRADRLIEMTKRSGKSMYINVIGGKELYDKEYFEQNGVELSFIKSDSTIQYKQFDNDFVPWLSIIDVMMFNSKEEIKQILTQYTLI